MAFKKKSKAPKKKAKSAKKDDWTFEGGQSIEDNNNNDENESGGKRKRRQTQDKDERLRRGRAKIVESKKKKQFTNKMSKKVKFGDVLDKVEIDNETVDQAPLKVAKIIRSNPLSVNDRLQLFLSKSIASSGSTKVNPSSDEESESDEDDEVKASVKVGDVDEIADYDVKDDEEDEDVSDEDDEDRGSEKVKDTVTASAKDTETANRNYDWFFSSKESKSSVDSDKKKTSGMKLLTTLASSDEVYGNLHSEIKSIPSPIYSLASLPGLHKLFRSTNSESDSFSDSCSHLLPYVSTYADTLIESRSREEDSELLHMLVAHAVTHAVKARAKVLKHNQKLKKRTKDALMSAALLKATTGVDPKKKGKGGKKGEVSTGTALPVVSAADITQTSLTEGDDTMDGEAMQDQGFSRPRVLILCPFRGSAVEVIRCLQQVLGENTSVSGLDKLTDEFSPPEEDAEDEDVDYGGREKKSKGPAQRKPADWEALFKQQNIDDDFKLGIQVNPGHGKGAGTEKGVYLRLFSDFFISDIIVASPIGLRLAIESAGSNTSGGQKQTSSIGDFLSSVEMVLLHQADVLYMQNWEHVDYVLKATNKLPNSNHDTDFSRVRPYFLEGNGALHRQLLMTSAFVEPEMQAFFRQFGQSKAGFVRVKRSWAEGSITEVVQPVKQVFQLVPGVSSFATQDDVRFAYFRDTVLSKVLQLGQKHTLIVTPSYLSYVRVRNELMNQQADAAYVCEYSRDSEISRGRSRFFHGKNDILLYSGRAHFFRRFLMKGARHIIFYSLPEYAHFYSEMVNLLDTVPGEEGGGEGSNSASCLVLYTPYERMALERLVGKERCDHMMSSKKATFMFC